jgi:hypothetical protein
VKCCRRVIKDTVDQNVEIGDTQCISLDIVNEVEGSGDNSLKVLRTKTCFQTIFFRMIS